MILRCSRTVSGSCGSGKLKCWIELAQLRLRVHEESAQVMPCDAGIPWLGFVA